MVKMGHLLFITRAFLVINVKKIINLENLLEQTTALKARITTGETSIIEEDLKIIFTDLSSLIPASDLGQSLQILHDGTQLLEQKVEAVQLFISQLIQKDRIAHFLAKSPDDLTLFSILEQSWSNPINFPQFSTNFLEISLPLMTPKAFSQHHYENMEVMEFEEKTISEFKAVNDLFEVKMKEFYESIKKNSSKYIRIHSFRF
jgi:hypothetical protein